jgi:hypothetical protein
LYYNLGVFIEPIGILKSGNASGLFHCPTRARRVA